MKQWEKDSDRLEARRSLGLNYECYRRDQFMAAEKAKLPVHLKTQMLEKTKKGADEKHSTNTEKLVKDHEMRSSDVTHQEIAKSRVWESPMKTILSKLKVEPARASAADVQKAHEQGLEYAVRDGLMSREK